MKTLQTFLATMALAVGLAPAGWADAEHSVTGVAGYDLVSYQTMKRPIRGNGHFTSDVDGVTYLFASAENKRTFDASPEQFLPAYGGYCAYGVSVGKKFVGDPEVWRIVDGRLYLNLDANIQDQWLEDVPGRIAGADRNWQRIEHKRPSEL